MDSSEDKVWYCTKCLSLDIRSENDGKRLYCHHCGADAFSIDFCDFGRWEELYEQRYGKKLLEKRGIYDDLKETYEEDAYETMTASEAISDGCIVRDVINLKITD